MATIHFLNVKNGDCSIIEHDSSHVTVIDVCNASSLSTEAAPRGNFNQKHWPENPIEYMEGRNIEAIFRYVQSHPDRDHMDGIKALFERFKPLNLWDIDNSKEMENSVDALYDSEDWEFYRRLRDNEFAGPPKRLTLFSGQTGKYWNTNEDGNRPGDGLYVLSPTPDLVNHAKKSGDYNDCSYVLLFDRGGKKAIFAGDSHDKTWEHILSKHSDLVSNIDLLIAPHHGRDSDRDYEFLNVLKPSFTLLGNAPSEHMGYQAWNSRNLDHVTNNQAGSVVIDASGNSWGVYVTNETFARAFVRTKFNRDAPYSDEFKAWMVCSV